MKKFDYKCVLSVFVALGLASPVSLSAWAEAKTVVSKNGVTSVVLDAARSASAVDYASARSLPLPISYLQPMSDTTQASYETDSIPASLPGRPGDGRKSPVRLVPRAKLRDTGVNNSTSSVMTRAFGKSNHPYTTSRVDMYGERLSDKYPYRAAGKLFFNKDEGLFVCSASLIKPGIVVTAAHCAVKFGERKRYSKFRFVPAFYEGMAPYGIWQGRKVFVKTSYFRGTENCAQQPDICPNDIALIELRGKEDHLGRTYHAGDRTGYLSVAWDGYGFTKDGTALISTLTYSGSQDSGRRMQISTSQSVADAQLSNNNIIGAPGGGSGAPWIVNFGQKAKLSGIKVGRESRRNVVVGVTSFRWGGDKNKEAGASPFTSKNIAKLLDRACPEGNEKKACGK